MVATVVLTVWPKAPLVRTLDRWLMHLFQDRASNPAEVKARRRKLTQVPFMIYEHDLPALEQLITDEGLPEELSRSLTPVPSHGL